MRASLDQVNSTEIHARLAALPPIPGWCSEDKSRALIATILEHKPLLSVEIGVFGGSSLVPQALALAALSRSADPQVRSSGQADQRTSGLIFGIDPWDNGAALEEMADEANRSWWAGVDLETIYQGCRKLITDAGLSPWCKLLRAKAEGIADAFPDGGIDLLHIDGNHSEELSVRDVSLYLPKVRPGGHVYFDDVTWTEGGVRTTGRALAMVLEECEKIQDIGDDRSGSICSVFRKRPAGPQVSRSAPLSGQSDERTTGQAAMP